MTSPHIDTDTLRETLAASTPGPWVQGDDFPHDIHAADGDVDPAIGCVFTDDVAETQWRADARLISMAPDLAAENLRLRARVEAMEGAMRMIDAAVFNDNGDVTYDAATMAKAHRIARAALGG